MAKVFITKYALTEGIKEIETDIIRSRFEDREYVRDGLCSYFRIGEKRIETIELSLKTLEVVQSRGACNQNTEYHKRIIELVKKNIGLIRNKLSA